MASDKIGKFFTSVTTETGKLEFTPDSGTKTEITITTHNKEEVLKKMTVAAAAAAPAAAAPSSAAEVSAFKKMQASYQAELEKSHRFYFPNNEIIDIPKSSDINLADKISLLLKLRSIISDLDSYLKTRQITIQNASELDNMKKVLSDSIDNKDQIVAINNDHVRLFHKLFSNTSAGSGAALVAPTAPTAVGFGAFGSSGGGVRGMIGGASSLLQTLYDVRTEISKVEARKLDLVAIMYPVSGTVSVANQKKMQAELSTLDSRKSNLKLQEAAIMTNLRQAYSSRNLASLTNTATYKINEDEYLINKSVEALKNKENYEIKNPMGGIIKKITNFSDLRDYIIYNTSDPVTLLLKLTDIHPISLNDYLPAIVEDTFTVRTNEKGILVVKNNDEEIEMPNPSGNKHNRQAYSTKFKMNNCYGFGGPQTDPFCVSLLNNCLASDKDSLEKCKQLFSKSDWEHVIEEGIQNTNIFFIKEFLLKIGYPRNNNKFDSNIDSWFKVIKSRYDITDTSMLKNIESNDKLKQAITGMVTKYNKIIEMERKSSSTSSRNFHLPMKGGDNMSIINSNLYELYGGLNQNVVNLPSLSPSQKVYNIFKELVKDQDITSKYRNFFDKMEKNIHNQNHDIDPGVRENFNFLLASFKQSEEKLNKLLQTMHNFAWFLGQTVNTSNLSDAEKETNEEAANRLNKVLNEENINAYNAAREKLVNSLNKKSQKLISIAAGHPFILIASS